MQAACGLQLYMHRGADIICRCPGGYGQFGFLFLSSLDLPLSILIAVEASLANRAASSYRCLRRSQNPGQLLLRAVISRSRRGRLGLPHRLPLRLHQRVTVERDLIGILMLSGFNFVQY